MACCPLAATIWPLHVHPNQMHSLKCMNIFHPHQWHFAIRGTATACSGLLMPAQGCTVPLESMCYIHTWTIPATGVTERKQSTLCN
eukprot:scaffold268186_cov19-Tisochrysis_lutea.AAC.1